MSVDVINVLGMAAVLLGGLLAVAVLAGIVVWAVRSGKKRKDGAAVPGQPAVPLSMNAVPAAPPPPASEPARAAADGGAARCPRCGAELAPGEAGGLCPACLLAAGLEPVSQADGGAGGETQKLGDFDPPVPATLGDAFPKLEILDCIGHGGMGAVYKVRQRDLDRLAALKILSPKAAAEPGFAERFQREARALARLHHPGVVMVHEFGESGGYHYLLMEYVDGASLRQVMRAGKLAPEQALAIVPGICAALQYAHEQGVVHRDIKPENILIDKAGQVKIADFGLAKMLNSDTTRAAQRELTQERQVMGTPNYMAPEQVERPRQVDHRADIYSLGVVFYEMLTGELPLGKFQPPSSKVEVDVRLDEVVLKALAKEPERRYQKAGDVRSDVEQITRAGAGKGNLKLEIGNSGAPGGASGAASPVSPLQNPQSPIPNSSKESSHSPAFWLSLAGGVLLVVGLFGGLAAAVLGMVHSFRPVADSDGGAVQASTLARGVSGSLKLFVFGGIPLALLGLALLVVGGIWLVSRKRNGRTAGNGRAGTGKGNLKFEIGNSGVPGGASGAASPASPIQNPQSPIQNFSPDSPSNHPAVSPRMSKMAVVGALWAPLLLLGLIPFYLFFAKSVAVPANVAMGPVHASMSWAGIVLAVVSIPLALLGATAPFGTTICGCVALGQIRRSAGRLYGLKLALFDALLYPLLLLDAILFFICLLIFRLVGGAVFELVHVNGIALVLWPLLSLGVCAVADFLIVRACWRAATRPVAGAAAPGAAAPGTGKNGGTGCLVAAVLVFLILLGLPLALLGFRWYSVRNEMRMGATSAMEDRLIRTRIFECNAELVDNLVPPASRSPLVPPPDSDTTGHSEYAMVRTAETDHGVIAAILADPGSEPVLLRDSSRDVPWWPKVADTWSYATHFNGQSVSGSGGGFVGLRRHRGVLELHSEYNVQHTTAQGESVTAAVYYEGSAAPAGRARIFLIPVAGENAPPRYLVITFEPMAGGAVALSQPELAVASSGVPPPAQAAVKEEEAPDCGPLNAERIDRGEVTLAAASRWRLEDFRDDLESRLRDDAAANGGKPGPNHAFLSGWLDRVNAELARRDKTDAGTPAPAAKPAAAYGPVIERELRRNRNAEEDDVLWLADGSLSCMPPGFFSSGTGSNRKWLSQKGPGVFVGITDLTEWGLGGASIRFAMVPAGWWENPPAVKDLAAAVRDPVGLRLYPTQGATVYLFSAKTKLPVTMAFLDESGLCGVLQVTALPDVMGQGPLVMHVRYRLAPVPGLPVLSGPVAAPASPAPPRLQFRLAADERDAAFWEPLPDPDDAAGGRTIRIRKEVLLDESSVASVRAGESPAGNAQITITWTPAGAATFRKVTAENVGRRLAVLFDGKLLTQPVIRSEIAGGVAVIEGRLTAAEAAAIVKALGMATGEGASRAVPVPAASENGDAVEGVAVQLTAKPAVWDEGGVPVVLAGVRNSGTMIVQTSVEDAHLQQVEVDGVWYRSATAGGAMPELAPGGAGVDVRLTLVAGQWVTADKHDLDLSAYWGGGFVVEGISRREPLRLGPGRHTVRVAFAVNPARAAYRKAPFRAVSNPVTLEIRPPPAVTSAREARLQAAGAIVSITERDQALASLALEAAAARDAAMTRRTLGKMVGIITRDDTARAAAQLLAQGGLHAEAVAVAQGITSIITRDRTLAELSR